LATAARIDLNRHISWSQIALRDAAFSLSHYGVIISALKKQINTDGEKKLPALMKLMDKSMFQRGVEIFESAFEKDAIRLTRNAVGHEAERHRSSADFQKNASDQELREDGLHISAGSSALLNITSNNSLIITWGKQHRKFTLNSELIIVLMSATQTIYSSFDAVEVELKKNLYGRQQCSQRHPQ
jgi:hypothetical protein